MNRIEQQILSAYPPDVSEQVQALFQKWKQKTVITCLLTLSGITVGTLLILNNKPASFSVWDAITICAFFAALILYVILNVYENQLIKQYQQIPALAAQPEESAAALAEMREKRKAAAKSAHIKAGLLVLCAVVLLIIVPASVGIALWILVFALLIESSFRNKYPTDFSAAKKLQKPVHTRTNRIGCGAFLVFGVSAGMMVLSSLMGSIANGKLKNLNAEAKNVYNAVLHFQVDCDYANHPINPITTIAQFQSENQFSEAWTTYYVSPKPADWYAVVFDADGVLQFALYSKSPITEDMLHEPDKEQQRKLLSSFTRRDEAIGYYKPSKKTEAAS